MQTFRAQDMQRQASVLQEAAMTEPVIITYHDRPRLVLMSMREYDRLRGRGAAGETELPPKVADESEALGTRARPPRTTPRHSGKLSANVL